MLAYPASPHACSPLSSQTPRPSVGVQIVDFEAAANQLSGTVPYWPQQKVLDMRFNRLTEPRFGAVPTTLQGLFLAGNTLTGNMLDLGSHPGSELQVLDLSNNTLSGSLPHELPPNLSVLRLFNNSLVGSLPSSWSKLQSMAVLLLDNNELTGTLPAAWSIWGSNTGNSLQLSIRNASLGGHMPRKWIEQFCLEIERSGTPRVLAKPIDISLPDFSPQRVSRLIQVPAQHASINVTLASKEYTFDYNRPDSVCGIPYAARNTALLWGCFTGLLLGTLICICLFQRRKPKFGPQGHFFSHWRVSIVLRHERLHAGRQVANRVWFLVSDIAWTTYSQVTDAITIHQVFSSRHMTYAYILLAILLVPFAVMFILIVKVSIERCQEKAGCGKQMRWAAPLIGVLLAPILFFVVELAMISHSVGVPLPAWWGFLGIHLVTFYRMQSVAEAFLSALPQAIVQSKLYLMGNDPNGVHVYIDTRLFLVSIIASLFSVFKTIVLIAIELYRYGCSFLVYCFTLAQFHTFKEYKAFNDAGPVADLDAADSTAVQLTPLHCGLSHAR